MSRAEMPNMGATLEKLAGTGLAGLGLFSFLSNTLLLNNIPSALERLIPKSLERNDQLALSLCLWALSAATTFVGSGLIIHGNNRK